MKTKCTAIDYFCSYTMKTSVKFLSLFLLFDYTCGGYWDDRDAILAKEASSLLGSSILLTTKEQTVNQILMDLKLREYDAGLADPSKFLPSIHFFQSKEAIERSEVFNFIKKMPKGASLHIHSSAMVSFEFLFNLTYYENLYGCNHADGTFRLHFFFDTVDNDCEWKLLQEWRREEPGFDDFIKSQLTLVVDDPVATYSDINAVWNKFESIFSFISPLLSYRPALHDYIYQTFEEFHDDNVMYLEIRGSYGETFDTNGTVYEAADTPQFYYDTLLEFLNNDIKNRDFVGFRLIYAKSRNVTEKTLENYIQTLLTLQKEYPELIAGFDLVGQEDASQPLSAFADQLSTIANQTKFFFHAGETNWYGVSTDLNLVDAVLLNATRIGHGFAISKHPEVLRLIKEKNIAIELNPISNQVLKLVDDLRNHVGTSLIAGGYPVVVTSDDPSFWGAKGLSYDWYLTFMGMTPRNGDLRILKQLAINSLVYSSMEPENKLLALAMFEGKWDDFLNEVLAKHY